MWIRLILSYRELFGRETGKKIAGVGRGNKSTGFLAKAKAQTVKRLAEKAAERAPVETICKYLAVLRVSILISEWSQLLSIDQ